MTQAQEIFARVEENTPFIIPEVDTYTEFRKLFIVIVLIRKDDLN